MGAEPGIERARQLSERAVFTGESGLLAQADSDLDGVEANLMLARGRVLHARFLDDGDEDPRELDLFGQAIRRFRDLGDGRGEGEAEFWVGIVHQVVRGDGEACLPHFERSLQLATQAGDRRTMSYALRHLGIVAQLAGRLDVARERLEESTRLRREIGLTSGVAANLVGLIYIAAAQGRRDEALTLADEALALATADGATRIADHVREAREAVG